MRIMSKRQSKIIGIKDVKGYEGLYTIDEWGNVYSIKAHKYLRYYHNKRSKKRKGSEYFIVRLSKYHILKFPYVHRLVAYAFIPNPENKKEVNHKDGNRKNNHISNLEWVTSSENSLHAIHILHTKKPPSGIVPTERRARGEDNGTAKFTNEQIKAIRQEHEKGIGCRRLARKYGTSISNIYRIVTHQTWRHIK
jgi:hypothetical protein